ncbi:hypothetical protein ANCCEY_14261 [Ancylostoma ceylanicum]|uniref:Uncharacterized protein n=1 Tax=Ancylostoma ceylanicum TaxID=53326 RepID=A0A0D6L5C9_9BILA|nr:hypothetical protein ANCCEY_14261 [Ancylostoma ceylanicum]
MVEFEKLPAGCYMPEKETEEEEADDSGQESDPGDEAGQLIDGLQHMLDTWTAGQKKASTRSAPPSVIIGLDDSELNEEDEDLFNTTLNSFNDSTSSEEQDDSVTEACSKSFS